MPAPDRPSRLAATAVRIGLGVVLAAGARVMAGLGGGVSGLSALEPVTAGAFVAGLEFGPAGAAGAVLGDLGACLVLLGAPPSLLRMAAHLAVALVAFLAFRHLPRVGRTLPNLRSYVAFLGAAAVGGLLASFLESVGESSGASPWRAVWVWWSSNVASTILLTPPVLALLALVAGAWKAPIPREVEPSPFRRWIPAEEPVRQGDPAAGAPAGPSPVAWLGPVATTLGFTATLFLYNERLQAGSYWVSLAFVVPILWAGSEYGLRGGLLTASLVGLCHLLVQPLDTAHIAAWHAGSLERQAAILLYSLVGALWGGTQQREARFRDQLAEANLRLRRDLERTVKALGSAIAAKDAYTEGHLSRVSSYASTVGRRLGLGGKDLEMLEVASLLHDVGKIGIPEKIIRKPGPLDAEEVERIQRHPEIGARILEDVDGLEPAASLVLHHQERFDGRRDGTYPGYPQGLEGEAIPLGARIIAVVDAFDAMTSDRPYRRALAVEEAIAVLREERGRQFDPRVVDTFLGVLETRPWD